MGRTPEHQVRLPGGCFSLEPRGELARINAAPENFDDDDVRVFGPGEVKGLRALGSLKHAVAALLEQGHHEAAIDRTFFDNKYRGHECRRDVSREAAFQKTRRNS
jgi:hypothetical protein